MISKGEELVCNTNCDFRFYFNRSPYIRAIFPNAIVPGEEFGLMGRYYAGNTEQIK